MPEQNNDLFLAHYGVKGMKWGVRRKDSDGDGRVDKKGLPEGYSKNQNHLDKIVRGKRGAKLVEKNVRKGMSVTEARQKADARRGLEAAALTLASPLIAAATITVAGAATEGAAYGIKLAGNTYKANKAANVAKKGAEAAAKVFSDSKGIPNYETIRATNLGGDLWG